MSHKYIFGIVDCSMRLGQDGVRAHMVLGCARFGLRGRLWRASIPPKVKHCVWREVTSSD